MKIVKLIMFINITLLFVSFHSLVLTADGIIMSLFDMKPVLHYCIINIRLFLSIYPSRGDVLLFFKVLFHFTKINKGIKRFFIEGMFLVLCIPAAVFIKQCLQSKIEQHVISEHVRFCPYTSRGQSSTNDRIQRITYTFERYLGEDIEFSCPVSSRNPDTWLFNGHPVKMTWRHRHHTTTSEDIHLDLNDKFRIYFLQAEDFGTYSYSCNMAVVKNETLPDGFSWEKENCFCVITLKEALPKTFHIRIPIGGLFENNFHYAGFINDDYFAVDKMVNGEPLQDICDENQSTCSPLLSLYRKYYLGLVAQFDIQLSNHNVWFSYIACGLSVSCMCPKAFGNHTTSYFRNIYNGTSKRYELAEIYDPHTYIIQPAPSPYLNWESNSSSEKSVDTQMYKTNAMNDGIVEENISFRNLFECAVFCFAVLICLVYIFFVLWYLYRLRILVITFLLLFRKIKISKRQMRKRKLTVCIACCEEDMRWTAEVLDPIIKGEGHKTFIHHRDSHPGQTELEGIRQGSDACGTFIIVISENSIDCPMWEYQTGVITDQLARRHIPKNNVLVVKVNGAAYGPVQEIINSMGVECLIWNKDQNHDYNTDLKMQVVFWMYLSDPHKYLEEEN